MAKVIENEKGFKVIEVSAKEMILIDNFNICDRCGTQHFGNGYYVAALNRWFCPGCYEEWYRNATNFATPYNADGAVEEKNFTIFKMRLGMED